MYVHQAPDFPPSWIGGFRSFYHHHGKASTVDTDVHAEKVSKDMLCVAQDTLEKI